MTAPLTTWVDMQRFMFPENKWVDAVEEARGAIKLLDLKPGASVLDMPCGVGRHSIQLSTLGMKVTGVDITPSFLVEARTRAEKAKAHVEWVEGDMLKFRRQNTFDAIANLYTSFGYFPDQADDQRVLDNFFASLKPGGKLLMDLMSRELFHKHMPPKTEKANADGTIFRSEHRFTDGGRWLENTWIHVEADGKSTAVEAGLRLYSQEELCAMLAKAGFAAIQTFGDFDGRPYSLDATHLLVLGTKK